MMRTSTFRNPAIPQSSLPLGISMLLCWLLCSFQTLQAQVTYTSTSTNTWSTQVWSPAGTPGPNDHVVINHNISVNAVVSIKNLTVNAGKTLTITSSNFTASGTTTVNGTLTDNNTTGTNTFTGLVTVASGGSFNTTLNSPYVFGGGISNAGTFSKTGTGAVTISGANSISGTAAITLGGAVSITGNTSITSGTSITFPGAVTLGTGITVTNAGTVSVAGLLNGLNAASTWVNDASSTLTYTNGGTPMSTGTLNASALSNTVNYALNGTQSIRGANYYHLTFSSGGTKTAAGAINAAGNFTLNSGVTFNPANFDFSAIGASTLAGTFSDQNATGLNLFGGAVSISGSLTNLSTVSHSVEFQNGITLSGSGSINLQNTGTTTFSTNSQSISMLAGATGSVSLATMMISGEITVSNALTTTNGLTIRTSLDGDQTSSAFINTGNLFYQGANEPMLNAGTFNASTSGNTVTYSGAAQTVKETVYHHLSFTTTGTKTIGNITVNGNFTRTNGTLTCTGVQTFSSNTAATLNTNTTTAFSEIIITKPGSTLTLTGSGTITSGKMTVSSGFLVFGTGTARTITLSDELSGAGGINLSGAAHILNLGGADNSIGVLLSDANLSVVNYNRTGDQDIMASQNYRGLTISGSGIKTLSGDVKVNGNLNMTTNGAYLNLGDKDIRIAANATLTGTFSATRYIISDGLGALIKEGTSAADIRNNMASAGLFPLGSGGYYTPYTISSLSASVVGTAAVSVRAVSSRQPNVPYFNNALTKYWDIETTNLTVTSANFSFSFNSAEVIGSVSGYVPRYWNDVSLSAVSSPATASAPGSNPFFVNGANLLAGEWTAIDPIVRAALYSYQSGDWGSANTWTTDPSGNTLVSPMVPTSGDQVVILNGRTVTTSVARTVGSLTINNGGTLDLGSSTGHSFGPIAGEGRMRLSTTSLPTGNYLSFTASTGGTIEYYNLGATALTLSSTQTTYNNLEIKNSSASNQTVILGSNLTVNGNFSQSKTGTGTSTFTIGNSTSNLSLIFNKNVSIGAGTTLNVGSFAATHAMTIYGNLTNSGTINLTNSADYATASNGAVNTTFLGTTSNTSIVCNSGSSTSFYGFNSQKTTDYELSVTASASATLKFVNAGYTLNPSGNGILRLGTNITVGRLIGNGSGNYDIGTPTSLPVLWIDGASVTFNGSGAIVPYGTLKITSGTLTCLSGQGGIVIRESGLIQIDGGTVNAKMIRTSVTAATHRGTYIQTGGTITLSGDNSAEQGYYAVFSLPYNENVFRMTGGTMNITRTNTIGSITPNGGFLVGCLPMNIDVSGGTVNFQSTGNVNFDITTRAPLYDVNIKKLTSGTGTIRLNAITWSYSGSTGNQVTVPAYPFVVLNNLTIQSGAQNGSFNANNVDVIVGGNLITQSGTTLNLGTNTLTFNGSSDQSFSLATGTLSGTIRNLVVNKTASTLQLDGTLSTFPASGNLSILAGTLNDGGKTLTVGGNIVNNDTHIGTGKISMNASTAAQTISGNGNGSFANLELANTFGAAGSAQITLNDAITINGTLSLTTDRLFNISIYRILLGASGTITAGAGAFSANRHIRTQGYLSDGGIVKSFSASATSFLYPFGTAAAGYTPATLSFTSAPATWGSIDVRPVGVRQLYVTDPNVFNYYWKVNQTGFTGLPANGMNFVFNYGTLTDNTSYIPGYYNYQAIAYTTINNVNAVDEAANTINFSSWSKLEGDYTAGVPAAFGTVVPYYSRANGNWNTPSTWSNTGFGGTPSSTIPNASVPVFIGDGTALNHTVTVTANNTYSGSLVIANGSTLDVGTTTGHNFGALPYATAGGNGKLRISSTAATAQFPAGDFGLFFLATGGTTEYYGTTTNFVVPVTTASPTSMQIRSYRHLQLSPAASARVRMPDYDLEIYGDLSINGATNASEATTNDIASRSVTIYGNFDVNSGTFRFANAANQAITVLGNLNVQANATLGLTNGSSRLHTLDLKGDLTNNGTIDFDDSAVDLNLTLSGTNGVLIQGTNAAAVTTLYKLIVNKGSDQNTVVNATVSGTWNATNDNWLEIQNGTFRFSRAGTFTLTSGSNVQFIIPATGKLSVNHSSAVVNVAQNSSANADLILAGTLELLYGTMNVGNASHYMHNDIEYSPTDAPVIIVNNDAVLSVNGQIRRSEYSLQGALSYTQTGNSTVLVRGKNPDGSGSFNLDRAKFEILNSGSSFTMSDNALLIIDRRGLASTMFGDIYLAPTSYSITGGEIRIGTSLTPSAEATFNLTASSPFYNLSVDGNTTNKTVNNLVNSTEIRGTLRIEGNSVFNANGLDMTIYGGLVNQNTNAATGLTVGGYRCGTTSQTTYLIGNAGNQTLEGVSGNLTNFANLVINNTWPAGSITLNANTNIRVNNQLTMTNGSLAIGNNLFTACGPINSNIATTTGSGYFVVGGTTAQMISGNGAASFGNFRMANNAGAELSAPITINGNLQFNQGLLYINSQLLTLGESATLSGTINSSSMIRLNGVISDAGVKKLVPATASDFTFHFGTTLKHTPVRVNLTSNSAAGSITIKPVNIKHPATTDVANKELTYYWTIVSTGLGSPTANLELNYHPNDAINGDEASYVTGRYYNSLWTPSGGIAGSVNALDDKITLNGLSAIDGEYTAGESSEFGVIMTYFSRNATLGGNWSDVNSWSTDATMQHAGPPCASPPNSNNIVIAAGHTINCQPTDNNKIATVSVINGTLNLNSTFGHNLGLLSGTGTIKLGPNGSNQYVLPGGDYTTFVAANGGTVEYYSTTTATLPNTGTYNHLAFSGSGTKNLPNANLNLNGDFRILEGSVVNVNNKTITMNGNWENYSGLGGWSPGGLGIVTLNGTNQNISGSTSFTTLNIAGGGVKTLYSSISAQYLNFTQGILATGNNEMSITASGSVTGGSSTAYVNGNLRKALPANTFNVEFEIGDASNYTPVTIAIDGNLNAGSNILARTDLGDDASIYLSGIDPNKSLNRTWTLTGTNLSGFTSMNVTFTHNGQDMDASANPVLFKASRKNGASWTMNTACTAYPTTLQSNGLTQLGTFQLGERIDGIIWTGAVSTNWNVAGNWLPAEVPSSDDNVYIGLVTNQPVLSSSTNGSGNNFTLEAGTEITIPLNYKLEVNGNLNATNAQIKGTGLLQFNGNASELNGSLVANANTYIAPGALVTLGSGALIEFQRDLNVQGTLNSNGQSISFGGAQNSALSGGALQLDAINISKVADNFELTLQSNVSLDGNINLVSGDINLNGKTITLLNGASLVGETTANRVFGNSGSIQTTLNLNAPNALNVAGLGAELTSSSNLGSTQIIRSHQQKTFNAGFGMNRYYEIHPTNNSGLDATLKFNYFDDELNTSLGTIVEGELDLWRFDGAVWNVQWATLDMINNQIVKTNIPEFSAWTGGSRDNNALPITLTKFESLCENDQIRVTWTTASETNNKEFFVEESEDALSWKRIYRLDGAVNSTNLRNYEAFVKQNYTNGSYFRLTQIDLNGKSETFDPVYVSCKEKSGSSINLSPNPAIEYVDVQFKAEQETGATLSIFSAAGQILLNARIQIEQGSSSVRLDISSLPPGVYHLNISSDRHIDFSGSRSIIKR